MELPIITTICLLLLLAYFFDITSSKTRIPSVILLLILGWGVAQITNFIGLNIPDLSPTLPILGTIGLILIVLEGSSELELNKSKTSVILKSSINAVLPILIISFSLGFLFQYLGKTSFKTGLVNAIPFAVISSAIAIPSANNLSKDNKEFIIYESSLSDIFGVIFFNFLILNEEIGLESVFKFSAEILGMLIISFIATLGLVYLLSKIKHHVKFIPIILIIVIIYTVSKQIHFPALIFVLLFGISLRNIDKISNNRLTNKFRPELLINEVNKFKDLTMEIAFLIRSLFFILFGYLMQLSDLLNEDLIGLSIVIIGIIFFTRIIFLLIVGRPLKPLLFIAPRGLITILLFLSIPASQTIGIVNKSLVIQVILISAIIMMTGLIFTKNEPDKSAKINS